MRGSPYKKGDIVKYTRKFKSSFPSSIEDYEVSMIIMKTWSTTHCGEGGGQYYICEVLLGDNIKHYDECYLELAK